MAYGKDKKMVDNRKHSDYKEDKKLIDREIKKEDKRIMRKMPKGR